MLLRALALVLALFMSGTALAQAVPAPPAPPAASPAVTPVHATPAPAVPASTAVAAPAAATAAPAQPTVPANAAPAHATTPAKAAPATGASAAASPSPPAVSQGDPRWKNLQLARGVTVGKAGCLFVSLFTSVIEMGYNFDVFSFLRTLTDSDLFDRFGRLRWDIQRAIPGLSAERLVLSGAAALAAAKERIADGSRIVLQVVTSRGTRHWIAVMKIVGDTFIVSDPDGGKVGTLSSLYGTNAVRGLAVLTQR